MSLRKYVPVPIAVIAMGVGHTYLGCAAGVDDSEIRRTSGMTTQGSTSGPTSGTTSSGTTVASTGTTGGASTSATSSSATGNGGAAQATTGAGPTAGTGGSEGGAGGGGTGGAGTGGGGTGGAGTGGDAGRGGSGGAGNGGRGGSGMAGTGGGTGGATGDPCGAAGLVWKTGAKTNFESYPAPGSDECIKYSGCMYEGQFEACSNTEPKSWVMSHNIAAVFPLGNLALHDICIKSGTKTLVVTALDTCGDSDCSGCCTQNKGSADALIDLESFTDARFGVPDGRIQWADLGPTKGSGCK